MVPVIALLWLLAMTQISQAATYYVATTGNDANIGSSGSPYRTIKRCLQSPIAPGDTCLVKAGTYTAADVGRTDIAVWIASSQGSVAGTAGNPITLKSEVPLGAVIKVPTINGGTAGIRISQSYYVIEGFDINGTGVTWNTGSLAGASGITVSEIGHNAIIRRNKIWDIARTLCSNSPYGYTAIFLSNNASGDIIEYNDMHKIGRLRNGESGCSTTQFQHDHAIYSAGADSLTIRRNIIYDSNRGYPIQIFASGTTHANINIYNNTISGKSPTSSPSGQVILCNIVQNINIKNNIFHNAPLGYPINYCPSTTATNVAISNNIQDSNDADAIDDMQNPSSKPASGVTASGNIFNATLGLTSTTSGSEDFTLLSTSAALNAGVDVGLAYNGAAPEMGAFEVPEFSSCEITSSSNIRVTFVNNVSPPLLPASSATTFTARKNTASNTVTGVARNGDNLFDITVTTSYVGGDNGDISWASGNITDSALLGGVWNQKYVTTLTNQSCTNSVGGTSYTLTQAAFRFKGVYGTETSTDWRYAENFSLYRVVQHGAAVVRFAITCEVADCGDQAFTLFADTGSGYAAVPDEFSSANVAFCGSSFVNEESPSNGSATTNQLSTAGTFVPGGVVYTANAIPNVTLTTGQKTELQYCIRVDADASAQVNLRVYTQGGSPLSAYTATPMIEPVPYQGSAGF